MRTDHTNLPTPTPTPALDPAVDRRLLLTGLAGVAGVAALANLAKAGPLTPPGGPITSTPGPEPRIAVNAQNTPGSAGAIFVITQPGSYYLTGNVQGALGKSGVLISASNVTLDLNGFTVQGVTGSQDGIVGAGVSNVVVCNGIVRGWPASGVTFFSQASNCVISNVTATNNANGLFVTTGGRITDCLTTNNSGTGISADFGTIIARCVSSSNATAGIVANANCIISDCLCDGNSRGIDVVTGCTVARCSVTGSVTEGIRATLNNVITDNTVRSNTIGVRLRLPGGGANRVERNTASFCGTSFQAESNVNFFSRNTSAVPGQLHWNMSVSNYIRTIVGTSSPAFTSGTGGVPFAGSIVDPDINIALT